MTRKTIFILIILGVILVAGGIFYFLSQTRGAKTEIVAQLALTDVVKPWIEITKAPVNELKADGAKIRELQTGDELDIGNIIEAGEGAMANIHFPDGSVARLDAGTKLVLDEASFDHQSEKLSVKINLLIGQVWSKIFALATPDSSWEVKTSNAVATVRGTAFGVTFLKNQSRVLGSENEVKVAAVDPQTKEVVKGTEKVVLPDKFFEVKGEDIPLLKKSPQLAVVKPMPQELIQEDFIKRNKEADVVVEQKFQEVKKLDLPEKETREEFRKEIFDEFKDKIKEQRIETKAAKIELQIEAKSPESGSGKGAGDNIETKPQPTSSVAPVKTTPQLTPSTQSGGVIKEVSKKPASLVVVEKSTLSQVTEGDAIAFEAVVLMSDGSKVNVTASARWQVLGPIGQISKAGVFTARLAPEVAEYGESSGSVVAMWTDSVSGETLLGKSPIFKVETKLELPTSTEG